MTMEIVWFRRDLRLADNPAWSAGTHQEQVCPVASLAPGLRHAPWKAPPLELASAGVNLGDTYPWPLVDHATARHRALEVFGAARADP